jgi:hypothetical protein
MPNTSTCFRYEESDIPEGLTLREWRQRQSGGDEGSNRRSRWRSPASFAAAVRRLRAVGGPSSGPPTTDPGERLTTGPHQVSFVAHRTTRR